MKVKFSIIIFLLMFRVCTAQNLVPNGDFEVYISCPYMNGQIYLAAPWINPSINLGLGSGNPNYFNQCNNPSYLGVPVNFDGYQQALSGVAYSGIHLWSGARDYIEVPLLSPLVANMCYHFEMYFSLGNYFRYTTDAIGVYFSDIAVTNIPNPYVLPFIPQINNTAGNYPDTLNWTLMSGNYTASGGENYLIIGNFKNDLNTNVILLDSIGYQSAKIYIDDVSLSVCTGSAEQNNNVTINIFPNPTASNLTITSPVTITQLKITNTLGQLIYQSSPNEKNVTLKLSAKGIYFVSVTMGDEVVTKKVVVE